VYGGFGKLRANLEAVNGLINAKDKVKALETSVDACLGEVVDEDGEVIFGWRSSMLAEGWVRAKRKILLSKSTVENHLHVRTIIEAFTMFNNRHGVVDDVVPQVRELLCRKL
jgi:hypothetical protein